MPRMKHSYLPALPYNARENVCFWILSAMCVLMPIVMGNAKANVCVARVSDASIVRRLRRLVYAGYNMPATICRLITVS